jgi:hypothetical protein
MDKKEICEKLKRSSANIRFEEICGYAIDFGFVHKGGKGSHRVFTREGVREILNLQSVKGMAKPYQVRQFIKIIERYGLLED